MESFILRQARLNQLFIGRKAGTATSLSMLPSRTIGNASSSGVLLALLALGLPALRGQTEPEGVLVYHQPLTSYAEAFEYRTFRQDNALYSTLVTSAGERKQLKSGGVIALVPYPPVGEVRPYFDETAATALQKISALEASFPQAKPRLEVARSKWARALDAYRQVTKASSTPSTQRVRGEVESLPADARLTRATAGLVTITHGSGVTTIPLSDLTPAQVLKLNATSRTIQLPLGTERAAPVVPKGPPARGPTQRVETAGRSAIGFIARSLGVADAALSVWTFFVILPALVLMLFIALVLMARRPKINSLPRRGPLSQS